MLNVHLICVGKLKEHFYKEAVGEYAKRLSAYCKLTLTEVPEQPLPESPSPAQIELALQKEAQEITAKLPKGGLVAAFCIEGDLFSSQDLAQALSRWMTGGVSTLTLLIGGSFGLHPQLKERAAVRLSMSPMTFPHHLARVMALEQLYRAFKINEGSSYHK